MARRAEERNIVGQIAATLCNCLLVMPLKFLEAIAAFITSVLLLCEEFLSLLVGDRLALPDQQQLN